MSERQVWWARMAAAVVLFVLFGALRDEFGVAFWHGIALGVVWHLAASIVPPFWGHTR